MQSLVTRYGFANMLLLALILAGLGVYAGSGLFTRFLADDYCLVTRAGEIGPWGLMLEQYQVWSGRYAAFPVIGLLLLAGDSGFWPLTLALILGGVLGGVWLLRPLLRYLRLREAGFVALALASVLTLALVSSTFSTYQSFYWISGAVCYSLPLVLLLFYLGLLIRHPDNLRVMVPLTAVFAFVNGGFAETYVAFQFTVFALLGVVGWFVRPHDRRRSLLIVAGVGCVASLVSLAVIMAAPGNAVRQDMLNRQDDLLALVTGTLVATLSGIASMILLFGPAQMALALLVSARMFYDFRTPALPFRLRPAQVYRGLALSALAAGALTAVVMAPSVYATSAAPSERVYVLSQMVLVLLAAFWGGLMSLSLRKPDVSRPDRRGSALLGVVLIALALVVLAGAVTDAQLYMTYAREWDARDALIRDAVAQGEAQMRVPPLTVNEAQLARLETVGPDPQWWTNQCAAMYYNLDVLVVAP